MSIAASGDGCIHPLRMKVRRGCPLGCCRHRRTGPRADSHACPGSLEYRGWMSTDRPALSPHGWMIGFSERDTAHNRVLLWCLFSWRCMRSWRSCGWPLSRPEAARISPPSSLPLCAQAHNQMHPAPGLVCSNQPEGRLHSCFDSSATQTVPTVCVRGSGMAVQGPLLRALPVSPCFYEGHRGRPYPATGSGHQGPQLYHRLAHSGSILRAVVRSQGLGASAAQPVGASGQLGK